MIVETPMPFTISPIDPQNPEQSFSLECEQWRHGTEEKHVSGQLFFDLDKQKISGALVCEVHAENLPSPVRMTVPVEISIKRVKAADRARLLVQDLRKAAR